MPRKITPDYLIHMLPYPCLKELCDSLDGDDVWMELAKKMPDISLKDVDGCRNLTGKTSPSWYLLRIWSSRGYRIEDLRNLLISVRLIRLVNLIDRYVNDNQTSLIAHDAFPSCSSSSNMKQGLSESPATEISSRRLGEPSTFSAVSQCSKVSDVSSSVIMDPLMAALQNTLAVSYEELQAATNNFDDNNIIGKGGYGIVYKGFWKQLNVAIKRITAQGARGKQPERERLRQSLQELRTLAKYKHDNILPIYAFCLEGPEPCLMYMFMANGSLDERIACKRGTPPLTWTQRLAIAEGTARGILFLHIMAKTPIIHGDVKSANILLDKHLEPKLGDFGLCRDGQVEAGADEKSPLIASHLKGTLAYLPPEFISSKILSTKLDVFSFGVVLYELASGLKAYSENRQPRGLHEYVGFLKVEALRKREDPRRVLRETLMDAKAPSTTETEGHDKRLFDLFVRLGDACANVDRLARPGFEEIVNSLATFQ